MERWMEHSTAGRMKWTQQMKKRKKKKKKSIE
jgi:hypothetical protein